MTRPLQLSLEFVRAFCAPDLDRLEALLAPDLRFEGPFHRFKSRSDYLARLRADPPENAGHEILVEFESANDVCLLWEYRAGPPILIAQFNRIAGDRISHVLLVFDGRSVED